MGLALYTLAQPPGYHTHDGFLLRMAVGFGGVTQTALTRSSGEVTAGGPNAVGVCDVAVGGVVGPSIALRASFWGMGVPKESTVVLPASGSLSKLRGLGAFGVGVTWSAPTSFSSPRRWAAPR